MRATASSMRVCDAMSEPCIDLARSAAATSDFVVDWTRSTNSASVTLAIVLPSVLAGAVVSDGVAAPSAVISVSIAARQFKATFMSVFVGRSESLSDTGRRVVGHSGFHTAVA